MKKELLFAAYLQQFPAKKADAIKNNGLRAIFELEIYYDEAIKEYGSKHIGEVYDVFNLTMEKPFEFELEFDNEDVENSLDYIKNEGLLFKFVCEKYEAPPELNGKYQRLKFLKFSPQEIPSFPI